jgi:hypothetical protein
VFHKVSGRFADTVHRYRNEAKIELDMEMEMEMEMGMETKMDAKVGMGMSRRAAEGGDRLLLFERRPAV